MLTSFQFVKNGNCMNGHECVAYKKKKEKIQYGCFMVKYYTLVIFKVRKFNINEDFPS